MLSEQSPATKRTNTVFEEVPHLYLLIHMHREQLIFQAAYGSRKLSGWRSLVHHQNPLKSDCVLAVTRQMSGYRTSASPAPGPQTGLSETGWTAFAGACPVLSARQAERSGSFLPLGGGDQALTFGTDCVISILA